MTIQDLINKLNAIEDKTRIVILQKDGEGNGFSPLRDIDDNATYAADNTWSGDVGVQTLTDDLRRRGFTEEDQNDGVPCLVLYPIN